MPTPYLRIRALAERAEFVRLPNDEISDEIHAHVMEHYFSIVYSYRWYKTEFQLDHVLYTFYLSYTLLNNVIYYIIQLNIRHKLMQLDCGEKQRNKRKIEKSCKKGFIFVYFSYRQHSRKSWFYKNPWKRQICFDKLTICHMKY